MSDSEQDDGPLSHLISKCQVDSAPTDSWKEGRGGKCHGSWLFPFLPKNR